MKKTYTRGLMLLVLACVLMHAFAKPADDVRLLYHILESFGYYTGYLHTKLTIPLWIALFISIPALIYFTFRLIWKDESFATGKSKLMASLIPFCILLFSVYSCYIVVPAVHVTMLRFSSGVDSIVFRKRTDPIFAEYKFNESGTAFVFSESFLRLDFHEFNSAEESFRVKLIDLNDMSEYEYPYELTSSWTKIPGTSSVRIADIIPGFVDGRENYENLQFKIVIYDETKSKTFNLYLHE